MTYFSMKSSVIAVITAGILISSCGETKPAAPTGQFQIRPAENKMNVLPAGMKLGAAIIHPPRSQDGFGTMEAQTIGAFNGLHNLLQKQSLTLGNVLRVRAVLSSDESGTVDYKGYQTGYDKFFGTKKLPSEPINVVSAAASLPVKGQLLVIEADIAIPNKPKPAAPAGEPEENQ